MRWLYLGALAAHSGHPSPSIENERRTGETETAFLGAEELTTGVTVGALAETDKCKEMIASKRVAASEVEVGILSRFLLSLRKGKVRMSDEFNNNLERSQAEPRCFW